MWTLPKTSRYHPYNNFQSGRSSLAHQANPPIYGTQQNATPSGSQPIIGPELPTYDKNVFTREPDSTPSTVQSGDDPNDSMTALLESLMEPENPPMNNVMDQLDELEQILNKLRPQPNGNENAKTSSETGGVQELQNMAAPVSSSKGIKRPKILNCSVCLKGFTSGPHMMRHAKSKSHQMKSMQSLRDAHGEFSIAPTTASVRITINNPDMSANSEWMQGRDSFVKPGVNIQFPKLKDHEEHTASTNVSSFGSERLKCVKCNKDFKKDCYLRQHIAAHHNGDKPFKCTHCGKRFSTKDDYQTHAMRHVGDKPYKCRICPKQFHYNADLRRHMMAHSGIRPYACGICGQSFIRKDHMEKHTAKHSVE